MRQEIRAEGLLFDFGDKFPSAPRPGSIFRRTDLGNRHFIYNGSTWDAIALDGRLSVEAPTDKTTRKRPITREVLKRVSTDNFIFNEKGEIIGVADNSLLAGGQLPTEIVDTVDVLNALAQAAQGTNNLTELLEKIRIGADEAKLHSELNAVDRPDWINGEFKPLGRVQDLNNIVDLPALTVNTERFDLEGNFVRTESCPRLMSNVDGVYIDNTGLHLNPYNDCDCGYGPACDIVRDFEVLTKHQDPTLPEGAYVFKWKKPLTNTETLWKYTIEGVKYPTTFDYPDEVFWRGAVVPTIGIQPLTLTVVSGECTTAATGFGDGGCLTPDQFKGKMLWTASDSGGCIAPSVILGHTSSTIVTNLNVTSPVPLTPKPSTVYITDTWNRDDYFHQYFIRDETGLVDDPNKEEYSFTWYSQLSKMKFRISSSNWWGQSAYQYSDWVELYPIPNPPTFTDVWGELGVVNVTVTGDAPGGAHVDGFELSWSSVTDLDPTQANPDDIVILYSGASSGRASWSISTNKSVYLWARSVIEDKVSAWIGYGQLPETTPLYETVVEDYFTDSGSPPWLALQNPSNGAVYNQEAQFGGGYNYDIRRANSVWVCYNGYVNQAVTEFGSIISGTLPVADGLAGCGYTGFFLGLQASGLAKITGKYYFVGLEKTGSSVYLVILAVHNYDYDRPAGDNLEFFVDYEIARSDDLAALFSGLERYCFSIERIGQRIIAKAGIGNESNWQVLDATDTEHLTFDINCKFIGFKLANPLLFRADTSSGVAYGYDAPFTIQRRNAVGYVVPVDPGRAVDVFKNGDVNEINVPFPITEELRFTGSNSDGDYFNFSLDDNEVVNVGIYNPYSVLNSKKRLVDTDHHNLHDLNDVIILNPQEGDILSYSDQKWFNSDGSSHFHSVLKSSSIDKRVEVSTNTIEIGNLGSPYLKYISFQSSNVYTCSTQASFILDTESLIAAGYLQPDGRDLRVHERDTGNEVPFWWIPETWNTVSTVVWVKLIDIGPMETRVLTVSHGDTSLLYPKANGYRVFDMFDDFEVYEADTFIDGQNGWNVEFAPHISDYTAKIEDVDGNKMLHLFTSSELICVAKSVPSGVDDKKVVARTVGCPDIMISDGTYSNTYQKIRNGWTGYNTSWFIYQWEDYQPTQTWQGTFGGYNESYTYDISIETTNSLPTIQEVELRKASYNELDAPIDAAQANYIAPTGFFNLTDAGFIVSSNVGNVYIDYIYVINDNNKYITVGYEGGDVSTARSSIVVVDIPSGLVRLEKGSVSIKNLEASTTYPTGYGTLSVEDETLYYTDPSLVKRKISPLNLDDLENVVADNAVDGDTLFYQNNEWICISSNSIGGGTPGEWFEYSIVLTGSTDTIMVPTTVITGSLVFVNGVLQTSGASFDYVDTDYVYVFNQFYNDGDIISFRSARSRIGATGPRGYSGYSGFSGFAGTSGFSGWSGKSGYSGTSGVSGYSGTSGTSGYSGAGTSGFSGYSGLSGYSGSAGAAGSSGVSGYSGASGSAGSQGSSGVSGFSGASGYSGADGSLGTSGISGYSGTSGYSGLSGFSGSQGGSGESGHSGYSGFSGFSGFSGLGGDGLSGYSGFSGFSGMSAETVATDILALRMFT